MKNKLKFEVFNNKKEFINKNVFVCHNCKFKLRNFNKKFKGVVKDDKL